MVTHDVKQVMTMANCIVGVSVLAMPFCFKQCGVVLASILLMLSGIMTRTVCYFLLKASTITRRRTYELLAYHTFGQAGKLVVEISIIGFLFGTLIAFLVVMGDLGPEIVSDVFGVENNASLRTIIMTALSLFVALPLGLLRNIDSLMGVSTLTMFFYLILVGKIFSEGMGPLWSGSFLTRIHYWRPAGVLQCIPIFSMALSCQTQIFGIYDSLPEPSLQKMNEVVRKAINMCTFFYISVGFLGYIAFCTQNFGGNILLSFRPSGSTHLIKLCFIMSIAFSFPLVIFPCRASLHSLIFKRIQTLHHQVHDIATNYIPESRLKLLTVGIIAFTLFVGLMIPNIELVLGLVGSTTGSVICIIFPSVMFIRVTSKNTTERILAQTIFFVGVTIMVVTTYVTLYAVEQAQVEPLQSKLPEEPVTPILPKMMDVDHLRGDHGFEPKKPLVPENIIIPEKPPEPHQNNFGNVKEEEDERRKESPKAPVAEEKLISPEKVAKRNSSTPKSVVIVEEKPPDRGREEAKVEYHIQSPLENNRNNVAGGSHENKVVEEEEKKKKEPEKEALDLNNNNQVHVVPKEDLKIVELEPKKISALPIDKAPRKELQEKVQEQPEKVIIPAPQNPLSPIMAQKNGTVEIKSQSPLAPKQVSSPKVNLTLSSSSPKPGSGGKLNQEDFLLQQLKEHEKEQKKLLEEQKEILAKLKQHQADDELKQQKQDGANNNNNNKPIIPEPVVGANNPDLSNNNKVPISNPGVRDTNNENPPQEPPPPPQQPPQVPQVNPGAPDDLRVPPNVVSNYVENGQHRAVENSVVQNNNNNVKQVNVPAPAAVAHEEALPPQKQVDPRQPMENKIVQEKQQVPPQAVPMQDVPHGVAPHQQQPQQIPYQQQQLSPNVKVEPNVELQNTDVRKHHPQPQVIKQEVLPAKEKVVVAPSSSSSTPEPAKPPVKADRDI